MVNDEIWIPTPDELDAEVAAERERRSGRRGGVRSTSPAGPDATAGSTGQATPRRTLRIGSDVTRRAGADGPDPDGAR
jgi:hypothetical protein